MNTWRNGYTNIIEARHILIDNCNIVHKTCNMVHKTCKNNNIVKRRRATGIVIIPNSCKVDTQLNNYHKDKLKRKYWITKSIIHYYMNNYLNYMTVFKNFIY